MQQLALVLIYALLYFMYTSLQTHKLQKLHHNQPLECVCMVEILVSPSVVLFFLVYTAHTHTHTLKPQFVSIITSQKLHFTSTGTHTCKRYNAAMFDAALFLVLFCFARTVRFHPFTEQPPRGVEGQGKVTGGKKRYQQRLIGNREAVGARHTRLR